MPNLIHLVRVYDAAPPFPALTFLIDRLWPRGISKIRLDGVIWLKEIAPSHELRKWFHVDPTRWDAFVGAYREELKRQPTCEVLLEHINQRERVTLLYGSKDAQHNHAIVLRDFLLERK
ncbi:DUF488 domain-containing protein [Pectobacterium sp. B1J-3]|uniref:DUF488 domain-containing protein n=1 Tax=Pectobacterium sp. B1J-3 TaxID=3385371 RepID=UPI003906599A